MGVGVVSLPHSAGASHPRLTLSIHMYLPGGLSEDDIHYALENTEILREPDRRIDTFGSTQFEFTLITVLMDDPGKVRVRSGKLEAARPSVVRPERLLGLDFDGFGEHAEAFATFMEDRFKKVSLLQYGFNFKRTEVSESVVTDGLETVTERVLAEADRVSNPLNAVLVGVDDTWEVCLLKFTMEMIQKSAQINIFDFKRRGLLDL